jgi:hypothetical protein
MSSDQGIIPLESFLEQEYLITSQIIKRKEEIVEKLIEETEKSNKKRR